MRELLRRLLYMLRYRQHQDDLADELQLHREMKALHLQEEGLSRADAAVVARRAVGNELVARQYARDVWIAPGLQEFWQDTRFAFRILTRDPGFALTAVLVLGLGIGVNNMMFTLIYTHTLRSLPIRNADRVLYISSVADRSPDEPLSYQEFVDIQTAATFRGIAAYASAPMTVGDKGRVPDRFEGAYTTANAIDVIGTTPVLGRAFHGDEDTPGAQRVAILGFNAWQSRYDGDPGILGRTILVNGARATVIGVMPKRSGLPITAEVWLPLSHMPSLTTGPRDARTLRVLGRIRDGVHENDARLEIGSIIDRAARARKDTSSARRARVVPVNTRFLGRASDPAWLAFLAASFIVVVVSSANVANMMIARAALRTRELAVRTSLGASRWRVVRQMLTESLVLAATGAGIAVGVSLAGVRAFRSAVPENTLPYWIDYTMDIRVFGALLLVAFATVLVFGLVPALQASRTDINHVLKDGGRFSVARGGTRRSTTMFLTAEFALTVVLLANAVVAFRSRAPQVRSDATLDTTQVLSASLMAPTAPSQTPEQRAEFYRRVGEYLRAIPGISEVSFSSVLPARLPLERRVDIEGHERAAGEEAPAVLSVTIAPRYFETLAVPLQRGRGFDANDGEPGRAHAIVNQRFVETFLPDREAIGQRISLTAPNAPVGERVWHTIIGVAQDIRQRPIPNADPLVYLPLRATPPATAALLVRSSVDTATLTKRIREELLHIDSNLPLYRAMTMATAIEEAEWNARVSTMLILSITVLALALSLVGLYGVTSYAVAQRTQELGVRMALGANPWHLRWFVMRHALVQAGIGLAVGIVFTLVWNATFSTGRADLSIASPGNMAPVAIVLTATALLASFIPARRATRLDPVAALRNE